MRIVLLAAAALLASCQIDPLGIELAPGWKAHSIAVWRRARPDMIAYDPKRNLAYLTLENPAGISSPSLALFVPGRRRQEVLLYGLHRADGLKFAPDGSLWIGEEHDEGLIWRIVAPHALPEDQRIDRASLETTHPAIAPLLYAGRFAHEGIAFSRDGRFAYLADEHPRGCLYRLDLRLRRLSVLARNQWLPIEHPLDARNEGHKLGCTPYRRIEDMETLPDGRVLMAETDRARILALEDRAAHPVVRTYLARKDLGHPDNLAWDPHRHWLWITDDSTPSRLLAWTGTELLEVARHPKAEITGVIVVGDAVWINLQRHTGRGTDLTLMLTPASEAH